MGNEVVCDISVSVDGYAAGPNQTLEKPFGDGPTERLSARSASLVTHVTYRVR